jgi:hypothetical protein
MPGKSRAGSTLQPGPDDKAPRVPQHIKDAIMGQLVENLRQASLDPAYEEKRADARQRASDSMTNRAPRAPDAAPTQKPKP